MPEDFEGDLDALGVWLRREYQDAIAARRSYDRMLDEWDRQYEQVPRVARKTFPWEGAANTEVPVGATHTDTIVSRIESTYFATKPFVIVTSQNARFVEHAQALQDFMNQISLPRSCYRQEKAIDILAMTKLGTSFQWLSYDIDTKRIKRDGKLVDILMHEGPKQRFVHPRHLIAPPDARDIDHARWITIRQYETWGEVLHNSHRGLYDKKAVEDVSDRGVFATEDTRREARQGIKRANNPRVWQNPFTFCLYQEDDMDEPVDLWINWHYPSGTIYRAIYNPYSHYEWPIVKSVYMNRESAFTGIGVMGMVSMIQDAITEIHNYCRDNLLASNTVVALLKKNTVKELNISPMAAIEYSGDKDAIRFERLGSALSGQAVGEAALNGYAEKRTGASEGNVNRMAPQRGLSSSRTPATTTMALLGESNKRFELAIENAKQADSRLLWQHAMLLRQFWSRQRVYADQWDSEKSEKITALFREAQTVLQQALVFEVSASSAALNQATEQANIMALSAYMREFYGLYLTFVKLKLEAPQIGELVDKILDGISLFSDRLMRTFNIRDPERFLLKRSDVPQLGPTGPAVDQYAQVFIQGGLMNGQQAGGAGAAR